MKHHDGPAQQSSVIPDGSGIDTHPSPRHSLRGPHVDFEPINLFPFQCARQRPFVALEWRRRVAMKKFIAVYPLDRGNVSGRKTDDAFEGGIGQDQFPRCIGDDDAISHASQYRIDDSGLLMESLLRPLQRRSPVVERLFRLCDASRLCPDRIFIDPQQLFRDRQTRLMTETCRRLRR